MTQMFLCVLSVLIMIILSDARSSLSISSVYVIVDPSSTKNNPMIELKDHYQSDQQFIGNINNHLLSVYIRGKNSSSWIKMIENVHTQQYVLSNSTNIMLHTPMSLKLTFLEQPYTNYSWYSFLNNLGGTTIYHLYIDHHLHSPTKLPTQSPTDESMTNQSIPSTTINAMDNNHNNTIQINLEEIGHNDAFNGDNYLWIFEHLWITLLIVSAVLIIFCLCIVSVCCCCLLHRRSKSVMESKLKRVDTESQILYPQISRRQYHHQRNRGNAILNVKRIQPGNVNNNNNGNNAIEDRLEIEAKSNVFRSISNRWRRMTSVSLQKASISDKQTYEKKENEHCLFVSPDSKSRTSVSICSGDPSNFVYPKMNKLEHTYSLSIDQVNALQHGFAVESDGICIKLDKKPQQKIVQPRNRRLKKIKGGYSEVTSLNEEMNEDDIDLSSSQSHESMYIHYDENETVETDDGITPYSRTPTNGSPTDFKISMNDVDTLPECLEGSCPTDQILK